METLLTVPDEEGYGVTENAGALLTWQLDGGPARTRLDEIGGNRMIALQWSGSYTRFKAVRDFLTDNLARNCPQFKMNLVAATFDAKEYICNVLPNTIKTSAPGGGKEYLISAQFEVEPRNDEIDTWPLESCEETNDQSPFITIEPGVAGLGDIYSPAGVSNSPQIDDYPTTGGQTIIDIDVFEETPFNIDVSAIGAAPLNYKWYRYTDYSLPILVQDSGSDSYIGQEDTPHTYAYFTVVVSNVLGYVRSINVRVSVKQKYFAIEFIRVTALTSITNPGFARHILQDTTYSSVVYASLFMYKDAVAQGRLSCNSTNFGNSLNYYEGGIQINGTVSPGFANTLTTGNPLNYKISSIVLGSSNFTGSVLIEFLEQTTGRVVGSRIVTGTGSPTLLFSIPVILAEP